MSKVGGALPAWYWPEGIPRRSPVPNQTIDRLIKKGGGRKPDVPAIVSPARTVSFGELLELVPACGSALAVQAPDADTVAVVDRDLGAAVVLALAAIAAGKRALICDLDADPATQELHLAEAEVDVVLTAEGATGIAGGRPVITLSRLETFDGERPKLRAAKAPAPALIIPGNGELVVHSQFGLAAMGVSLAAFVPELKELALVAPPPLCNWESLAAVMAALMNGATVYTDELDAVEASGVDVSQAWSVLLREQADGIAKGGVHPDALTRLAHLFVSTAYFDVGWRRKLEHACGREVLPLWGTPELGPAVAAHPSWFPLDAHGIPLVNVRVVPVDPTSGDVSVVPWEMLERAEIGVESPAAMLSFVREGADEELRAGKILRTRIDASVDHVGVVILHKPSKSKRHRREAA